MKIPVRIALFGFGRIGRNIFRIGYDNPNYEFVVISDFGEPESLHYLLMRDSIHGPMKDDFILEDNHLVYGNRRTRLLVGGAPGALPWDVYDVDIVLDTTGAYRKRKELEPHLKAGAKRVIVSKPPIDEIDRIVIPGLNDKEIQPGDRIISTTSATTQVLALTLTVLDREFGVERAMMTTVHAYTSDQPLADAVRSDLRRSRSAVENIIPNETWAPDYVETLIPKFKGKLSGVAFNVPVPNGSCIDLTTEPKVVPTVDEVNAAVKKAAESEFKDLIGYTEDPIVSSDLTASGETLVFDSKATMIAAGKLVKTISWFDNGWGFGKRVLDVVDSYATLDDRVEVQS